MEPFVFIVIIIAAAGHALWNCLLKFKVDPATATTMLAVGGGIVATPVLFVTGMPDAASRPYLAVSVVIHIFYWSYLGKAYSAGELGQIYPIARGTAPLLTTIGAMALFGEYPDRAAWIGIVTVVAGVLFIAARGGSGFAGMDKPAVKFAITTALCIMGYSLVDGFGARQAGSAFAYTAFLYVCNGWALLIYGLAFQRQKLVAAIDSQWWVGLLTGSMSLLFYGIGVWAMTQAPVGLVAALRETSILFAILFGTLMLKEPIRLPRICGAGIVCLGLVLIKIS
jgi:drug/metabolite transporter (DMT)-like permease